MGANWMLRYQPRSLDQVVYHDKIKEVLKRRDEPCNLMFYGPNGTGKTCLATLFAVKLNYPYMYLDCYEESWEEMYPKIVTFQESLSLTHPHISRKIVIIDNINQLKVEHQHALYKILPFAYFFFISNYCHHFIGMIRSKFIEIFVGLIPPAVMKTHISSICEIENRPIPDCTGTSSMRQLITIAQFQPPSKMAALPTRLRLENLTDLETVIQDLDCVQMPEALYARAYSDRPEFLADLERIEFGLHTTTALLATVLLEHAHRTESTAPG